MEATSPRKITNGVTHAEPPTAVRFGVLAWLCSLAAITYVDRICIMQVRQDIENDLGLTPASAAWAFSAFSLAYAMFEVPSGWLGDRLGSRAVLTRIVLCWTLFTTLTGTAWSLASLVTFRFLFGVGEAGAFPNIARASGWRTPRSACPRSSRTSGWRPAGPRRSTSVIATPGRWPGS